MLFFLQRTMEGFEYTDTDSIKIVECSQCAWFVTYEEVLWTSNEKPHEVQAMNDQVVTHARRQHQALARIIRGWKP
jgi:hypothetical protein